MSLLKDDREQYVVGGIVSAISKTIGKKIPKSKLKKDLSQPTNKDFENVSREEILDYIETLPLNERLELYGSNSPLTGKFEILDSDKINFYEDVVNFNKLPDDYKSGDNSLLKAYLMKNDIPEKYMGDFDAAGEFKNVTFFKELENGKIQITIPPSTSMGKKKTKTFTNPSKKEIDNFFKQRETKNMGGLLENDETRMGYSDGRVVYGEEEGFDVVKDFIESKDAFVTKMAEAQLKDVKNTKDRDEFIRLSIKDREKVAKQYNVQEDLQADIKAKVREMAEDVNPLMMGGRQIKAEGGAIDDQMLMVMTPPMESEMEPDEDMEDGYTRFIMEEALTEDEEDMLMSKLEQDEELAMLFDKVIDVAQEFAGAGPVEGPGSGVSDSIPARLSDGEFVFTAKAVEEIGADNLMAMMKDAEAKADERQPLQEGGELKEETMATPTPMTEQVIRVERGPQTEQVGVSGSLLDSVREEENPLYEEMAFKRPPVHGAGYGR